MLFAAFALCHLACCLLQLIAAARWSAAAALLHEQAGSNAHGISKMIAVAWRSECAHSCIIGPNYSALPGRKKKKNRPSSWQTQHNTSFCFPEHGIATNVFACPRNESMSFPLLVLVLFCIFVFASLAALWMHIRRHTRCIASLHVRIVLYAEALHLLRVSE